MHRSRPAAPPGPSEPKRTSHERASSADNIFEAKRTGLAKFLFGILRPGDARAAAVDANFVKLSFAVRFTEVALGDLDAIGVDNGRRWARVRLRHAAGREAVSGLSREDARALADALETARSGWW